MLAHRTARALAVSDVKATLMQRTLDNMSDQNAVLQVLRLVRAQPIRPKKAVP